MIISISTSNIVANKLVFGSVCLCINVFVSNYKMCFLHPECASDDFFPCLVLKHIFTIRSAFIRSHKHKQTLHAFFPLVLHNSCSLSQIWFDKLLYTCEIVALNTRDGAAAVHKQLFVDILMSANLYLFD